MPFICGMCISDTTTANGPFSATTETAWIGFSQVVTSYCVSRLRLKKLRMLTQSSTIKILQLVTGPSYEKAIFIRNAGKNGLAVPLFLPSFYLNFRSKCSHFFTLEASTSAGGQ